MQCKNLWSADLLKLQETDTQQWNPVISAFGFRVNARSKR